nr:hypothetical protein BgiMline_019530 [Biomphalaria glabrata]
MKGSKEGGHRMKESSFLKLILISFFIDCVAQHSNEILKISKYNKISLESSCQQRYVDESDSLVYLAVLQTSHLNMSQLYVAHFQMEQPLSQSFEQMCSVKVWNSSCESDPSKSNCYCQSNDDGVLSLILNMTANLEHSERTLQFILSNATSGDWNMTAETKLPKVYSPVNLTLLINGQSQDKYMCNITTPTEIRDVEITWCVQSVLNYTLHISTRSSTILNSSFNGCVMYTLTPAVLFENVTVSYIEVDDCQRHQSYRCTIYSRDNQNSCVDMCQDVVLTHVVITIIVILISSVCILISKYYAIFI